MKKVRGNSKGGREINIKSRVLFRAELKPRGYYLEHVFYLDHVIFTNMTHVYYSSVLNRSHVANIWNFDPNYSLPNVTQDSLPKKFQIVATWLQFSTEE